MLSTREPIPWELLSSSLKRASRAQGHYSHAGLSQEREGRSCVLGDEPLKSLSFPVTNLQSGWKCPWGSILTWCCLHGPEAEAHTEDGLGSRTGSQHSWCFCAHCSIPVLAWKVSPSPRVACCKGTHGCSQHPLPQEEGATAPTRCQGSSLSWQSQGGKTSPPGAGAPRLH